MIHMKEQNCIEAEKLEPVFDLIDEKVTFHAEREKVKRNLMDVLNAGIVHTARAPRFGV